jgi:hypothetical protein
MEQLMGITDCTDPCQSATPACGVATVTSAQSGTNCYNTTTGLQMPCPIAGTTQGTTPGTTGPFGTPMTGVSNLNWGLLAAVAVGFFVLAAVSGK